MATFDEREKSFEQKYKHDQELQFKINARRNRLLGLWVADQFSLSGEEKDAYAKSVVMADFEKPGEEDVVEKILADCKSRGVEIDEHRLRRQMTDLLATAKEQIRSEIK